MREFFRESRLTKSIAVGMGASALALSFTGCAAASKAPARPLPDCKEMPSVGQPVGYDRSGFSVFHFPRDATCNVPVFDPHSGQVVTKITPGADFYADCVDGVDIPHRMEVTVTGDKIGWSGDVTLGSQAYRELTVTSYALAACPHPEPPAVSTPTSNGN